MDPYERLVRTVIGSDRYRYVDRDDTIERTSRGKFVCPLCGVTWANLELFWLHHLNRTHWKCYDCGGYYVGLQQHRRVHRP